ncbi:hypothetical protein C9374_012891 [Naegleria lovaniensis]|uniref:Acid phosphatase n=1 Tax=Naegleria lovaniensis TaxID=51637 RepID=A0AA88GCN3_NAELO|nr:uncharacterized protein C9374_012891 [Naegleria lovaniensis]KAG2373045.1 hypothetical protein C9374_012891 [Naegleria lovaniensis]
MKQRLFFHALPLFLAVLLALIWMGPAVVEISGKIVQIQVLSRHCDRSPVSLYQIPNDPWDWQNYLAMYSYAGGNQPSVKVPFGQGQLTGLGLQQCFQVGQQFNQRYLSRVLNSNGANVANPNVIDGLVYPVNNDATSTAHWNPQDFRFYATDYDRTLFSVFSIAQGMFPLGTGPVTDISINGQQNSLPNYLQPIPVHTQSSMNELWMSAYGKCPTIDQRNAENEQSPEYLNTMQKFKPFLTELSNLTGIPFQNDLITSSTQKSNKNAGFLSSLWFSESSKNQEQSIPFYKLISDPSLLQHEMTSRSDTTYPVFKKPIDFSSLYIVYDLLMVQKSHNKLTLQAILDAWDQVQQLGNVATLETFSRKVQGKLGGGPLVQKIIVEMDKMVNSLIGGGISTRKPYPYGQDPDENTSIPYKYLHYSAHDVSILSLMAALRLTEDYEELRKIPQYGANIILELHQSDASVNSQKPTEKDFYVRIRYNSGFNETSFKEYSLLSLGGKGCQNNAAGSDPSFNCSFTSFKDVCYADAIPHDWCSDCQNNKADLCVRSLYESKRSENTIMMIMLPIVGGFSFILLCFVTVICLRSSKLSRYIRGVSSTTTPLTGEGINHAGSYYTSLK